jgi:hypothetical protein
MRLNPIVFLLFMLILSGYANAQKASVDNIAALRNIINVNIKYSDSVKLYKHYEGVIVCVSVEKGKVTAVHCWTRDDSKIKGDIIKTFPAIMEQWTTKSTDVKRIYIPVMITQILESNEPLIEKGSELLNMLHFLALKKTKDAYFDKLLVLVNYSDNRSD